MDVWVTVSADEMRAILDRVVAGDTVRVGFRAGDGTPIAMLSLAGADLEYLDAEPPEGPLALVWSS